MVAADASGGAAATSRLSTTRDAARAVAVAATGDITARYITAGDLAAGSGDVIGEA